MRAGHGRMARSSVFSGRNLNQRKRIIECRVGLGWIVHYLNRAVPDRRDRPPVADRDEWGQVEFGPMIPAFGDHFRTDAGWITKRNRDRRIGRAWHQPPPLA